MNDHFEVILQQAVDLGKVFTAAGVALTARLRGPVGTCHSPHAPLWVDTSLSSSNLVAVMFISVFVGFLVTASPLLD